MTAICPVPTGTELMEDNLKLMNEFYTNAEKCFYHLYNRESDNLMLYNIG